MANRAYLFSADHPDDWECPGQVDGCHQQYYDSRHVIPLSWFLFFNIGNVRIFKMPDYIDPFWKSTKPAGIPVADLPSWQEIRFSAHKGIALRRFLGRRSLLMNWGQGRLAEVVVDRFLESIEVFSGRYLQMDTSEIDYQDEDIPNFARFLERIDAGDQDARSYLVQLKLNSWVGHFSEDPEACERDVIGWTYGSAENLVNEDKEE